MTAPYSLRTGAQPFRQLILSWLVRDPKDFTLKTCSTDIGGPALSQAGACLARTAERDQAAAHTEPPVAWFPARSEGRTCSWIQPATLSDTRLPDRRTDSISGHEQSVSFLKTKPEFL